MALAPRLGSRGVARAAWEPRRGWEVQLKLSDLAILASLLDNDGDFYGDEIEDAVQAKATVDTG